MICFGERDMSGFRFMRMIVFFDLPTLTNEDKRNYRKFRKALIKMVLLCCRNLFTVNDDQSIYGKIYEKYGT